MNSDDNYKTMQEKLIYMKGPPFFPTQLTLG